MMSLEARDSSDWRTGKGYKIIVAGSVLTAIATFGMIARLVSARMRKRGFAIDDALLIFSFSLNVFQFGVLAWSVQHAGWGRHASTVSPQEMTYFAKAFLVCSLVQPALLMSAKMSVLILLYKIFVIRKFRITVIVFMVIVMAWWVSITLATFLICSPFDSNWGAHPANCGNTHVLDYIAPIPWIVTDFGILLIPLPVIRTLHLPLRQKIALTGLFLIGGLTCVISCVRYRFIFFSFDDITYETTTIAIWQLAESNITVLCACLIASKPFAMLLIPDSLLEYVQSSISRLRSNMSRRPSSSASTLAERRPVNAIQKDFSVHLQSVPRDGSQTQSSQDAGRSERDLSFRL